MEMIKKLTVDDVSVRLYAADEDRAPYEAMQPASSAESEQFAQAVKSMKDQSPVWGWCVVIVHVVWGPFEAKQYMGECSYESADDFKENSGYYDDMVKEALSEINADIQAVLVDLRNKECI